MVLILLELSAVFDVICHGILYDGHQLSCVVYIRQYHLLDKIILER